MADQRYGCNDPDYVRYKHIMIVVFYKGCFGLSTRWHQFGFGKWEKLFFFELFVLNYNL